MEPSISIPDVRYRGEGRCLLCLASRADVELTDEHIIPEFLSGIGEMIVNEGSCVKCQRHQNEVFEQKAANADFLIPRMLLSFRRKKKKKPKPLPPVAIGNYVDGGGDFIHRLSVEDYPPVFSLVMLAYPPGILEGVPRSGILENFRLAYYNTGKRYSPRHKMITMRLAKDQTSTFLTIAKIAYFYAASELGTSSFNGDEIRDLLLRKREDTFNFEGRQIITEDDLPTDVLHGLYLRDRNGILTVLVHLFASMGFPPHEVVVGSRLTPSNDSKQLSAAATLMTRRHVKRLDMRRGTPQNSVTD